MYLVKFTAATTTLTMVRVFNQAVGVSTYSSINQIVVVGIVVVFQLDGFKLLPFCWVGIHPVTLLHRRSRC